MKAIHRMIFQDVYPFAGQERIAPVGRLMTKDGPNVVNFEPGDPAAPLVAYGYYPAEGIAAAAADQFRQLAAENYLRGLPQDKFVERLAEHWGEVNTIHAFREGNTRSQFVFFTKLAERAGYRLDNEPFKLGGTLRNEFVNARFYNQVTGRSDRLAAVLAKAVTPIPQTPTQRALGAAFPAPATEATRQHDQGPIQDRPAYRPSSLQEQLRGYGAER